MDSDREDESPDFPLDSPTDRQHDLATPVEPREPGTKQDETVAVNVSGQEESEEPERPNGAKLQPGELVKRLQRAQANSHATNAVRLACAAGHTSCPYVRTGRSSFTSSRSSTKR